VLPLSPGRVERHGLEYYRHGPLSLYAALDGKTGQVHGMTASRHTSQEFIAFLEGLVKRTRAKEIHVVLDHLSAHNTKDVERFLETHPRLRFHFTPTYSSWLNPVELWFAQIQREVIARAVFTSVADLGRKLRRYLRAYSKSAKPFRWTYTDPSRRITTNIKSPDSLLVHRTVSSFDYSVCSSAASAAWDEPPGTLWSLR
jgi:transposase